MIQAYETTSYLIPLLLISSQILWAWNVLTITLHHPLRIMLKLLVLKGKVSLLQKSKCSASCTFLYRQSADGPLNICNVKPLSPITRATSPAESSMLTCQRGKYQTWFLQWTIRAVGDGKCCELAGQNIKEHSKLPPPGGGVSGDVDIMLATDSDIAKPSHSP